jgi:arabinan endo-1,5-alpha-L-arabinosidase
VLGLIVAAVLAAVGGAHYPNPLPVTGATGIHDPSMAIRPGDPRYVVYGTLDQTLVSTDRVAFRRAAPFFPAAPAWWRRYNPHGDVWAPDVSYHAGRYWMYYAVSAGARHSAIGVATSPAGLPGTWTDRGPVVTSNAASAFDAVDPNLLVDAGGHWWLTFGSYATGIYTTELDPATGRLAPSRRLHHLAERAPADNAIEAAFVYRHDGWYYLFTSWNRCCAGLASTYSIHVGRARCPDCHYYDASGRDLLAGGGTTLLDSHGFVIGPGGQSVYRDGGDLLVYHYYDGRRRGRPTLGMNFLGWDAHGFPYVR